MTSKLAWRTAAVLGSLAILGYAGFVLIKTTPFDTTSQAQMQDMPGMEHDEMPGMPSAEPKAEMEHEAAEPEMGGHDMSPVDVSDAPVAGPKARGGQLLPSFVIGDRMVPGAADFRTLQGLIAEVRQQ